MSGVDQESAADRSLEELAEKELRRRLEDPEEAKKLAGTGLLNLVVLIQKQKEPEKVTDEDVDLDVLEVIRNTDLPEHRKQELITEEIALMEVRKQELLDALEVDDGTEPD